MIIETKYNIGDNVYVIYDGKIKPCVINRIETVSDVYKNKIIVYRMNENSSLDSRENQVYGSRQEAGEAWLNANGLEVGIQ